MNILDQEIHHIDEDRYNDTWRTLVCLHKDDHEKFHLEEVDNVPF
jgi:hypothetical protein